MIDDNRFDKIRWNSRRGMKELDLMLEPFVESYFPTDERILKIVNIIISYHDELLSKENN